MPAFSEFCDDVCVNVAFMEDPLGELPSDEVLLDEVPLCAV